MNEMLSHQQFAMTERKFRSFSCFVSSEGEKLEIRNSEPRLPDSPMTEMTESARNVHFVHAKNDRNDRESYRTRSFVHGHVQSAVHAYTPISGRGL